MDRGANSGLFVGSIGARGGMRVGGIKEMTAATYGDAAIMAVENGENPVDYLRRRGYLYDVTDEKALRRAFDSGPVTAYIGFDPTATSLHVGHLLGVMMLATLQRFGHRPIALGGGGTALVGDPSGKTSTRAMLTPEAIDANLQGMLPQFGRYLDFAGGQFGGNPAALLMNNADWLLPLRYIDFLRDIGRHFSVNEMLAVETYRQRLESGAGLNFVEFNYRLVQSYDFLHLYQSTGCLLQMGGSDQWGNIVAGVDLVRRVEGVQAFGLVSPLLTTAAGQKMGKTEGNSVWLDPAMTSPYDYYQYWINVDDADVEKLLNMYTFVPDDEITALTRVQGEDLRVAKRVLAIESTALTHGREEAMRVDETSQAKFSGRSAEEILADARVPTRVRSIPTSFSVSVTIADMFIDAGLVKSRGEARRLAEQGGLSMNFQRVTNVDEHVSVVPEVYLLQVGKKRMIKYEVR